MAIMNYLNTLNIAPGNGICYSGFRDNQRPGHSYPSYEQVKQDLLILAKNWKYLRVYDCDPHCDTILEVIQKEKLEFKIMLGAYITAEMNNHGCPWGGVYSEEQLAENKSYNVSRIKRAIHLANAFPDIICSLSAGNEACVDWSDHYVSVESVIDYAAMIKKETTHPVTFCENYVPWLTKLEPLAHVVDFISIHTYPVWEYKNIHEALDYTKGNYYSVADKYPNKPVVISEAGWATRSNGRGINPDNVSEEHQKIYYNDLIQWCDKEKILLFAFEAFDEKWKGSPEPMEPEKHWGLFRADRVPKLVMEELYSERT